MSDNDMIRQAKIAKEKAANGFKLDLKAYILQKETVLTRSFPAPGDDENHYHRAMLGFRKNGPKNNDIILNISKWEKNGYFDVSRGFGYYTVLKAGIPRRDFKLLLEETKTCSDEYLNELLKDENVRDRLDNPSAM